MQRFTRIKEQCFISRQRYWDFIIYFLPKATLSWGLKTGELQLLKYLKFLPNQPIIKAQPFFALLQPSWTFWNLLSLFRSLKFFWNLLGPFMLFHALLRSLGIFYALLNYKQHPLFRWLKVCDYRTPPFCWTTSVVSSVKSWWLTMEYHLSLIFF